MTGTISHRIKLTKTAVANLSEPGLYIDSDIPGFMVRIGAKSKTYQLKGKVRGETRPVYVTIGRHNDPWTTPQARQEAERLRALMRQGINPNTELKARKATEEKKRIEEEKISYSQELTLRYVFEEWRKTAKKTKDSTKSLYKDVIYKHLNDWLDLPMIQIKEEQASKRYEKVSKETLASANNAFRALRMLFNWARKRYKDEDGTSIIPSNPVTVLSERQQWEEVAPRKDYIEDDDLPAWYKAASTLKNTVISDYFRLLLVTGLRKNEAAKMTWHDVDFKRECFTVTDTKNGRPLTLPMTLYTKNIFERRKSDRKNDFVFPGTTAKTVGADVRRNAQFITAKSAVEFSPHALRRTFAYAAARVRLGDSERKALLNHMNKNDVTDFSYTPWQFKDLKEALELVQDNLLSKAQADDYKKESITRMNKHG